MIVKSILDTDLYKFTTSYAYMKLFPQARGTFEFFDRDFDPIQDLWKTEVYGLANYLRDRYRSKALEALHNDYKETCDKYRAMSYAMYSSCKLIPTDGLGISNSDLEQIGARTYYDVDRVLQTLICKASPENDKLQDSLEQELGREVVHKIIKRHTASEFKRKKAPIYISRELYE